MKKKCLLVGVLILILSCSFIWANGTSETQGEKKTVLKVAHIYDPMGGDNDKIGADWFEGIKKNFEADNPNVEVKFENFAWDQIDVKMMQDFRSSITDHDVTMSTPQLFPQHNAVGDLADLNPFITRDWSAKELGEFSWASTYQQGNFDGKQIAIPMGSHSRIMLYNKEMFKKAGLDPTHGPRSIDEMIAYAKKLTIDTDNDGKIDQYGLGLSLGPDRGTIEVTFAPLIWNYGGQLWDTQKGQADFASEAGVKTTELIWDLVNTYKVVPPSSVVNSLNENLFQGTLTGKVAMVLGWGSYWIGSLEKQGFVKGVIPPSVDAQLIKVGFDDYPTNSKSGFTNSWGVSIYGKSENKDIAWKFINYMLQSNELKSFPDAGLPIRKSVWDTPEYKTEYYEKYYKSIEVGRPMPRTPYYGELADVIFAALQKCMNAQKSDIPAILANAQTEFNTKYAK